MEKINEQINNKLDPKETRPELENLNNENPDNISEKEISQEDLNDLEKTRERIEDDLKNSEISETHQEVKETVSKKGKSVLEKFRQMASTKTFRAAFISLMLFAKIGQVSAENAENVKNDKENHQENFKPENRNSDNYIASYHEFAESAKLRADNYFVTDKAEISPENQERLAEDFRNFLNTINTNNFKDLISKQWVVKGSSDQRKTNNWSGSNEELTKARISSVKEVISNTLKSHNFENLNEEEIKAISEKEIIEKYPFHNEEGKENGVTYLSDLINEETGKKYTEKEIENIRKNDNEKYLSLLDRCRYTNFEIESNFFELERFDRVHFLIDESGSMEASKHSIAKRLREIESNKPIELYTYSDLFNPVRLDSCHNNQEAANSIVQQVKEGSFRERQVDAIFGLINKLNAESKEYKTGIESQKIYLATDEALQQVSSADLQLLKSLADKSNIEVEFIIGYSKNQRDRLYFFDHKDEENDILRLSLDDVIKTVDALKADSKIANSTEQEKNRSNENIIDFYRQDYQKKAQEMEMWIKNASNNKTSAFINILKASGFGESPEEIRENLEKEYSGAKNYLKLFNLANDVAKKQGYQNIEDLVKAARMGGRGLELRQISDAFVNIAVPLRELIDSYNKLQTIEEAVSNLEGEELPNMNDNTVLNVRSFPIVGFNQSLPINGPKGVLANIKY